MGSVPRTTQQIAGNWFRLLTLFAVFATAAWLAWRNRRLGRADGRGALRLAAFTIACSMAAWACLAHHVPAMQEFTSFTSAIGVALLAGAAYGVLYMALEPYVRRRWPQSLISWGRLLNGGWRDPLVGGHVLIGTALGVAFTLLFGAGALLMPRQGSLTPSANLNLLVSAWRMAGIHVGFVINAIGIALGFLFTFFLLRAILRRQWLAAVVFALLFASVRLADDYPLAEGGIAVATATLALWTLIRCGVLPMVLAVFVSSVLPNTPLTWDLSVWYAGTVVFSILLVIAIALYSAYTALAGRPLFSGSLLES